MNCKSFLNQCDLRHGSLMDMAFLQGRPDFVGRGTGFNEGMLRRGTFHENERLNSSVVDFPMVVSPRFEVRVRHGKKAIKIEIKSRRKSQYAHDVLTPSHVVIGCPVKKRNGPPACLLHTLDGNRRMRNIASDGSARKR